MAYEYDPMMAHPRRFCHPECHCSDCCQYGRQMVEEITYRVRREMQNAVYQIASEMRYVNRPAMNYLPEPSKTMKLTTLAKKLFDSDTRAFIKAGILDESLEITTQGTKFLLAQYLTNNKKELAKEARKKIREDKGKEEDSEE